jgi:hypothetical protein
MLANGLMAKKFPRPLVSGPLTGGDGIRECASPVYRSVAQTDAAATGLIFAGALSAFFDQDR